MFCRRLLSKGMSPSNFASQRTRAIAQHMMSTTTASNSSEPPVKFESNLATRTYVLNRAKKLNVLNDTMLALLRPKIEEWSASDLCKTIVGVGAKPAFCAGGDVAEIVTYTEDPTTRQRAIDFFRREFEMDYILATLPKPYVAVLDGVTMGGGAGLVANAPFRIATENTKFAMPEAKIGYCPDVGGNFFLSRMDGELGTYLALTSEMLVGRAVFEHGFATHYVPSRRIPMLLDRLAALEDAHISVINNTIEEFSFEKLPEETPSPLTGSTRTALDYAFRHDTVEKIVGSLEELTAHKNSVVSQWAKKTSTALLLRSPTSLKVALKAIRAGRQMSLLEALEMELKIATAFCSGATSDFATGVRAVLLTKTKDRPQWSPASLDEVTDEIVQRFFSPESPYLANSPSLSLPEHLTTVTPDPMKFALPTEADIARVIRSSGNGGISLDELLNHFKGTRQGKMGVEEKIVEVTQRKCQLDHGNKLEWIGSVINP